MKNKFNHIVIALVAVGMVSLAGWHTVSAQTTLTNEQRSQIISNCLTIKNSLNQLHATDALLRVNRGQVYESMASKLMETFNTRLSNNGRDVKGLELVTSNYRSTLTDFRNHYQEYDRQLTETIKIDCSEHPDEFHASLLDSREKRAIVHEDVKKLHRFIDDYRSAVDDYILNDARLQEDN